MKTLNDYTVEEKDRLFNTSFLRDILEIMVACENYNFKEILEWSDMISKITLTMMSDERKLANARYKSIDECRFLEKRLKVFDFFSEVRVWYAGGYKRMKEVYEESTKRFLNHRREIEGDNYDEEYYNKAYPEWEVYFGYDELYEKFHKDDEKEIAQGHATLDELCRFVWETVRFLDVDELRKLLGLCTDELDGDEIDDEDIDVTEALSKYKDDPVDKIILSPEFEKAVNDLLGTKSAHRPSKEQKIYKYDLQGKLIATYKNRAECINANNISKQALYNVITGKRKQHKGYKYVEEK